MAVMPSNKKQRGNINCPVANRIYLQRIMALAKSMRKRSMGEKRVGLDENACSFCGNTAVKMGIAHTVFSVESNTER